MEEIQNQEMHTCCFIKERTISNKKVMNLRKCKLNNNNQKWMNNYKKQFLLMIKTINWAIMVYFYHKLMKTIILSK